MTQDEAFDIWIDICIELGENWTAQPYTTEWESNRFYLHKGNEKILYVSREYGDPEEKFTISGIYPANTSARSDDPKMGINIRRGAKVVASEIRRRILGDVERLIEQRKQEKAKSEFDCAQMMERAKQIGDIFGLQPCHRHGEKFRVFVGKSPIEFSVYRDGGIRAEINTNNLSVILQIAKTLQDAQANDNQKM